MSVEYNKVKKTKTIIQNDVNLENYEIILMTCLTFAHNSFINLKCVDYINFYLLKNASSINIYKLIDVLNLLSQYENIINYQIINFLYDKVKFLNKKGHKRRTKQSTKLPKKLSCKNYSNIFKKFY